MKRGNMRQLLATTVLAAAVFAPSIAAAQIKTLPGESHTVTAKIGRASCRERVYLCV